MEVKMEWEGRGGEASILFQTCLRMRLIAGGLEMGRQFCSFWHVENDG